MKPLPLVLLVLVCSLGSSFLFLQLFAPPSVDAEADSGDVAAELSALRQELSDLRAENGSLEDRLAAIGTLQPGDVAGARSQVLTDADLDRAVERWMSEKAEQMAAIDPALAAGGDAGEGEELSVEEWLAKLDAADLSAEDAEAVWTQIREAGLLDEAIALLEAEVQANPMDTATRMALTGGYYQKIFEAGNSPEAGVWATKADTVLNQVLDLDPEHWDARFSKAVGLSFWPPVFGKQGEAVRHFEILLEQQSSLPPSPQHAQTYLFLGNMYQQMGDHAKAMEVWSTGLGKFPEDSGLKSNIENAVVD